MPLHCCPTPEIPPVVDTASQCLRRVNQQACLYGSDCLHADQGQSRAVIGQQRHLSGFMEPQGKLPYYRLIGMLTRQCRGSYLTLEKAVQQELCAAAGAWTRRTSGSSCSAGRCCRWSRSTRWPRSWNPASPGPLNEVIRSQQVGMQCQHLL